MRFAFEQTNALSICDEWKRFKRCNSGLAGAWNWALTKAWRAYARLCA